MLFFRLTNQTSKNVVNTTFKDIPDFIKKVRDVQEDTRDTILKLY